MQFEVNGQSYFLNYVPAQGWMLFAPTPQGIRVTRVTNDDAVDGFEEQDEKPAN